MPSSRMTPKLSPCNDGAHSTSAPRMRRVFSFSLITPSHSMRSSWRVAWRSRAVSGPSEATQSRVSAGRRGETAVRTPRPLRRSRRATNSTRRTHGGRGWRIAIPGHVDPVPDHLVGAPDGAYDRSTRLLRDHRSHVEVAGGPVEQGPQGPIPGAFAGAVERADQRAVTADQRRHGRTGRQGLVDVHHIELFIPESPEGPQGG